MKEELTPTRFDGFPFMRTRAASFPLNKIFPSISVETEGILSKTSNAVPPRAVKSLPTVYIFLSSLISTVVCSAIISTSSSDSKPGFIIILPRSVSLSNSSFSIL